MIDLLVPLAFTVGTIAQRSQDGINQVVGCAVNRSVDRGDTRCCKEALGIAAFCWMCRPYSVSPRAAVSLLLVRLFPILQSLLLSGGFPRPVSGSDPHPTSSGLANGMVEGRAVGEDPAERAEAPSPPGPGPPISRVSGTLQTAGCLVTIEVSFLSHPEMRILL